MSGNEPASSRDAVISVRAAELWRIAGSPPGREGDYRAAAEAELRQDQNLTERTASEHTSPEDQTTDKTEVRRR